MVLQVKSNEQNKKQKQKQKQKMKKEMETKTDKNMQLFVCDLVVKFLISNEFHHS
jgi:23S rRNA pseudoU1915 N3-methylase RlmH